MQWRVCCQQHRSKRVKVLDMCSHVPSSDQAAGPGGHATAASARFARAGGGCPLPHDVCQNPQYHVVEKIQFLDPLYITFHFPNERSYKQLKKRLKSTHYPVASLSRNVAAFLMAVLYQADHAGALSHPQAGLCDCVPDDVSVPLTMALECLVTLCCHLSLQQLKALGCSDHPCQAWCVFMHCALYLHILALLGSGALLGIQAEQC